MLVHGRFCQRATWKWMTGSCDGFVLLLVLLLISRVTVTANSLVANEQDTAISSNALNIRADADEHAPDESRCGLSSDVKHVFYNRVPKAASTSLRKLIGALAGQNQYKHVSSNIYNDRGWFEEAVERINAERISKYYRTHQGHVIYDQHVRFINFTKFGLPQPAYINMVREPVARLVSTYYFARTGDHSKRDSIRAALGEQADWSINACVQRKDECKFLGKGKDFNLMTRFFCGHHEVCKDASEEALQRAIYNLRHEFILVGVAENFTQSVLLLERWLPAFFEGAAEKFHLDGHKHNVNKSPNEPPTEETRHYLEALVSLDTRLYHKAADLFRRRWAACFPAENDAEGDDDD